MMTRKHFEAIASVFKEASEHPTTQREKELMLYLAEKIGGTCRRSNPNFNLNKFIEACNLPK